MRCVDPKSNGEERRDFKKSWNCRGLFMVGGFALSSRGDETPHSSEEGRATEKQTVLRDINGRFVRKEIPTAKRNITDRTRGISEFRAKRKLEFCENTEENTPPAKRETRASQVGCCLSFLYFLHKTLIPFIFLCFAK